MKSLIRLWWSRCRATLIQLWHQLQTSPAVQESLNPRTVRSVRVVQDVEDDEFDDDTCYDDDTIADLAHRIVLFVYMLMKQTGVKHLTTPYVVYWDTADIRLQMGIEDEELFMQAWFWAQDEGWIARPNPFGKVSRRLGRRPFAPASGKPDYLQ